MRWMVLGLGLMLSGAARADVGDVASHALFGAAQASLLVDMLQTASIGSQCPGFQGEKNPILGRCPGNAAIVGYFVGIAAAQTALHLWGPRWLSNTVSGATLALQIPNIANNLSLGVGLRLPF